MDDNQDILDAYLHDLQAGRAPDRAAILSKHPDLKSMLDTLDQLERLAPTKTLPPTDSAINEAPTLIGPRIGEAGQSIGKFAIERELGRGGMGVVYLARDKELNRLVALKMILAGSMASDEYLQRFQSEVRASAQLDHEGIVRVYDSGAFNGLPYLAMQFIDGPTLGDYLRTHKPDFDWSARCLLNLARTVAYLHKHGIVHRDLKPANVLLAACGVAPVPKVTDFGLAKLLEEDSITTRSGVIVGTPSYMAPEQASGNSKAVGPPADLHALGAMLYEMLTGRPPFRGDTSLDTLLQVMGNEPISPRRIKPNVPRDLEAICLKCLEKNPERRFESATQLAEALERFLKGEDVPTARLSVPQVVNRWMRRNPALASRIAILATCVFVLCVTSAISGSFYYSPTIKSVHLGHLSIIFAIWLGLSWIFQRFIRREIGLDIVPYIWAAADITILTTTLVVTDSLFSPIDIGFPLLVAASGLWLREQLVWFTASCACFGYAIATAILLWSGPIDQVHRNVIFLAGLVTMGFLVTHQVQRFRALSRYYEGRS